MSRPKTTGVCINVSGFNYNRGTKTIEFFQDLKFNLYLTKSQISHLQSLLEAMMTKGFRGKVEDVSELASHRHRTSITRFLTKSSWNEGCIKKSLRSFVHNLIWKRSRETEKSVYFIIDDTISEKTRPSSKAKSTIEKCGYHNSHLKAKTVYGHQIIVSLLSCDGLVLPYSIDIYDKGSMSKIDIAKALIVHYQNLKIKVLCYATAGTAAKVFLKRPNYLDTAMLEP